MAWVSMPPNWIWGVPPMTAHYTIIDNSTGENIPFDMEVYRKPQVIFISVCMFASGFCFALWLISLKGGNP
jgi:hypothetical protein